MPSPKRSLLNGKIQGFPPNFTVLATPDHLRKSHVSSLRISLPGLAKVSEQGIIREAKRLSPTHYGGQSSGRNGPT